MEYNRIVVVSCSPSAGCFAQTVVTVNPLTPTVAIRVQLYSIMIPVPDRG